ncbi:tetratricopeptide repeat protein [Lachnospiraceae bacterium 29-84]
MDSYNRIICLSNEWYNDGLEKARMRDLSGAVQSLKKCLSYYKSNIQARNLLGLVYFEMGEAVDALSEWIISRSLQPKDNLAEQYLEDIQFNRARLNAVNQTIKKYNQALQYCYQGSQDLAVIQLKKVLSMNPKLVKGYQLLALLYMEEGKYVQARKELRAAAEIDNSNVMTLRYLREVNQRLGDESHAAKEERKESKKKAASYQSGNDTIIQPVNGKDHSVLMTILNLVIGVGIGVLLAWFLIIPGIRQKEVADGKKAELEASDSLAERNQEIKSLEGQIKQLKEQIGQKEQESGDTKKELENYEKLLAVYDAYVQQNIQAAGDMMSQVDAGLLGSQAKAMFQTLSSQVGEQYTAVVYAQAEEDFKAQRYPEAVAGLEKVVAAEEDHNDGYAIYYLAQSYYQTGDKENAKKYFQRMIELHAGTLRARRSQEYLNQIEQETQP